MAIPLMSGFSIGGPDSVDSRLVLTKAEMLAMKDSGMPDTYFCTDKDSGDIYTYNKNNTPNEVTGKFVKFEGGGDIPTYTQEEWDALKTKPAAGTPVIISNDVEEKTLIDDNEKSGRTTYSSSKIESLIPDIADVPMSMTKEEWIMLDPKPKDGTNILITDDYDKTTVIKPVEIEAVTVTETVNFSGSIGEGYVTNSGKDFTFSIPLPISNAKNVKINLQKLQVQIRQDGNYLDGSSESGKDILSKTTPYITNNELRFTFKYTSSPTNTKNNSAIAVYVNQGSAIFTYTREKTLELVNYISDSTIMDYKSGDKIKIDNQRIIIAGHITADKTCLQFTLPLPKRFRNSPSIIVNTLKANIRRGSTGSETSGQYLINTSYVTGGVNLLNTMNINNYQTWENMLYIELKTKSGTIANSVNNVPVSVQLENLDIDIK